MKRFTSMLFALAMLTASCAPGPMSDASHDASTDAPRDGSEANAPHDGARGDGVGADGELDATFDVAPIDAALDAPLDARGDASRFDVPRCVPGSVSSCTCASGTVGMQRCAADGSFDSCECPPPMCSPGSFFSCACPDGTVGSQVCGSAGTYGDCVCSADRDASPGTDAAADAISPGRVIHVDTSSEPLVRAFADVDAWLVVTSHSIRRVPRDGSAPISVPFTTTIRDAAFDGTTLVVADETGMRGFDAMLASTWTTPRGAPCSALATISGRHRVICTTNNAIDVFDATSGTSLSALPTTYMPNYWLLEVPAADTVLSSVYGTDLYHLGATDVLTRQFSRSSSSLTALVTAAFLGSPADHIVDDVGTLLAIDAARCFAGSTTCFAPDGLVGNLGIGEHYLDAVGDLAGHVITVFRESGPDAPCQRGCRVQRVDVATHTVQRTMIYTATVFRAIHPTYDPVTDGMLLPFSTDSVGSAGQVDVVIP